MPTLLERILTGDQSATIELYQTYAPKLLRFLQTKLPQKEDAQEMLNDIFLEAIDGLAFFQGKSSMQTWLYAIARHKITDFYRKRKVKSLLLSQVPFLDIVAREIHEPEFIYEKEKIKEKIENTLHCLSEKYQKILRLHYEEDMPIKQIARKLDMSFLATQSLLFRARKAFQLAYETY